MTTPLLALGFPTVITLAEGLVLLAWFYLPIVVVIFGLWARVVAGIFDKDAAQFYLPRERWNAIHVSFGAAALLAVVAVPAPGFITLPIMTIILVADLLWYFIFHNKDERVPEAFKWSLNVTAMIALSKESKGDKVKASSKIVFQGPNGELPVPERHLPEYEVRVAAEELIHRMVDARGSQLDVMPSRDGAYSISALVDGVRQPMEQVSPQEAVSLIDLFKAAAGLDLADRRKKQIGMMKMGPAGTSSRTPVRVSTIGGSKSIRLSILLDPESQVQRQLDELGLLANQLEDAKAMADTKQGVVLIVSPPDNGRTSTLYAFVRQADAYLNNVQTVEIDPQTEMEGVRANIFEPTQEGADFSSTVRSIVRRDPNIVAIAEMPDEDTAKVVSKAEHDRVRCYLSFSCDNALAAIQVYAKAVGDQKLAAASLHGAVAQRLARRLCKKCRVQFQPTPEMVKKLGLPPDTKQLYRKSGQILVKDKPKTCEMCAGSGFFGQVGVFEVFPLGSQERELIAANDLTSLKARFRKAKRPSIQTAALQHAINGETSIEEVVRITAPPKSAGAARPSARQPAKRTQPTGT